MTDHFDEIDRAAHRCKEATGAVKATFLHALAGDPLKELDAFFSQMLAATDPLKQAAPFEGAAREAVRAFEHVRERIVPQLDAILISEQDFLLRWKHSSIRTATAGIDSLTIKAKVLETMLKPVETPPVLPDFRVFIVADLLADVFYGCFLAMLTLPELSADLAYVANYVRARHAMAPRAPEPGNVHVGDVIMGTKHTSTITNTNSNVGAQAAGDNAHVTGQVSVGAAMAPTQAQLEEHLKAAKKALVDDEDHLDDTVREALSQFLTMARRIQVDQQSVIELQARMKETLDEVWAQHAKKGLRPAALPAGLKVIESLAGSPITASVAKHLLGG